MVPIRHLEIFSGIGGFRQAFEGLQRDGHIHVENVGFSENDKYAVKVYKANYDTTNEHELGDIFSFVQDKKLLKSLPDAHILTAGFPCQSFSMMGKRGGFDDTRGNLFFHLLSIIRAKKPSFLLLENVKNLLTHNKGETFGTICQTLTRAGYPYIYYDVFNTKDFCLAQNRSRVFIFASRKKFKQGSLHFCAAPIATVFQQIVKETSLVTHQSTHEILEKTVESKYYLSRAMKATVLADGLKKFHYKSDINQSIARPLTATMAKMHRACQDNYFSDDFLQQIPPHEHSSLNKSELLQKNIRRLTPKETLLLQGFNAEFYERAKAVRTSDSQIYKQAGNAVSVNTVYAILYYLFVVQKIVA